MEKIEPIYFSDSVFDTKKFINPDTYKGRGRPKKSDYMTFWEMQDWLNLQMEKASGVSKYAK